MDPSVFCWIAAQPPPLHQPAATPAASSGGGGEGGGNTAAAAVHPRAGSNFGVPHRDFTCLQSLRKEDSKPNVLSVWLPLNRVTSGARRASHTQRACRVRVHDSWHDP